MAPEEEFSALRDIFFADLGGKFTVFANSLVITAKKAFYCLSSTCKTIVLKAKRQKYKFLLAENFM